ncbi:Xylose isomerase domain protein TIM barrel [Pirellula staleyi DSM 6068]|uniref:Xylose isomerase domain protein TIM barrel n=1 Tax=Pirellula staleyi (strain ATCC 27377 / DSM 6068 / ICPB 4128) TaxID=530564 RepID=D2R1A7_PIRSD|nr:sugar phosphate isomerase/epimerase family protein [Pirellula staleyi]ADB14892.1 Xylose isomerase domain protein TIM barrel [Pirellula staleyi DSM 6068]
MKFAICNETFQDWPHEKAFHFARELGYTGMEVAPFTLAGLATEVTAAQRAELRQLAEKADLEIIGLHWLLAKTSGFYLTTPDKEVRHRTGDYLADLAHLCRDLGGNLMVLGSPLQRNLLPGVTHEQALDLAADCITRALPTLEECGVTIAVEPLGPQEGDFLNTAASGADLIERIGSANVRLHLDVKAMSTETIPIPDLLRTHRSLLHHFHANDPNRQGPGMGEVDFHPILSTLQEIDYRGWVSVEVFDYTPGVEHLARQSIENLCQVLDDLADE